MTQIDIEPQKFTCDFSKDGRDYNFGFFIEFLIPFLSDLST